MRERKECIGVVCRELTVATITTLGLSVPVSVNELQRKLEEEVEKRREEWEAGQGKDSIREEALIRADG